MKRLGELLVQKSVISMQQLMSAEQLTQGGNLSLAAALVECGALEESQLLEFICDETGVPMLPNLDDFPIDPSIIKLLPEKIVNTHLVVPIQKLGQTSLVVAINDPTNHIAAEDIRFHTGLDVSVVAASEAQIKRAIERYYGSGSQTGFDQVMKEFDESEIEFDVDEDKINVVDLEKSAEDAPVVKLVNLILVEAIKRGTSDIHIESYEKEFRIRYRIDGVLYEMHKPPLKLRDSVISRLKIMASLDIAERRLPQDGRIKLKLGKNREMDFRVSVLPTLFGEKVVMRLLDKGNLQLDMTKLGFEKDALSSFQDGIHQPYGMVLVTGPTGSGKTTTLYSALSELNQTTTNISTAEDPVEFNLHGINQVQMHESIGLNFASALRSFLRQDPDIIMVGEIRDFETGEIAIKAALTGHLVLSTLHTNDAPSTISRLLNMGIEPFLITASLNAIVAQRLARRICSKCKEPAEVSRDSLMELQVPEDMLDSIEPQRGRGCNECSDTGYKGRVALYEVLAMNDELKELVLNGASTAELKQDAIRLGMRTLRQSAILKLKEGTTTVDEVMRVSARD